MAEGTENSGSKKKLFIVIAVVVVLLLGGGVGAWFMMGDDSSSDEEVTETVETTKSAKVEPAYYVILPQPFIFNVTGEQRDRLVQVKVQLMVRGDSNEATANQHIPLIESTLLQTFGAATVDQLRTSNGRTHLRQQALFAVQNALTKVSGQKVVERVLFTGFVMQ